MGLIFSTLTVLGSLSGQNVLFGFVFDRMKRFPFAIIAKVELMNHQSIKRIAREAQKQ